MGRRFASPLPLLGLLLFALPVPAGAATNDVPAPVTVKMIEFRFDPPTITIPAGTTVTWTYDESATDPVPNCESPELHLVGQASCPGHSTTSSTIGPDGNPLWDSGVHRASGFPFSHTFTEPGTYPYYCVVHGGAHPNNPLTHMDGTIVVTAAAARSAEGGAAPDAGAAVSGETETRSPAAAPTASATRLPLTGGEPALGIGLGLLLAGVAMRRVRGTPPN